MKMKDDDKLDLIDAMMDFLNYVSYTVPHLNLPYPKSISATYERPEKTFKYHRFTRAMTYKGWHPSSTSFVEGKTRVIEVHGVSPDTAYINRIFNHLTDACYVKARNNAKNKIIPEMDKLILQFSGLGFLNKY